MEAYEPRYGRGFSSSFLVRVFFFLWYPTPTRVGRAFIRQAMGPEGFLSMVDDEKG